MANRPMRPLIETKSAAYKLFMEWLWSDSGLVDNELKMRDKSFCLLLGHILSVWDLSIAITPPIADNMKSHYVEAFELFL